MSKNRSLHVKGTKMRVVAVEVVPPGRLARAVWGVVFEPILHSHRHRPAGWLARSPGFGLPKCPIEQRNIQVVKLESGIVLGRVNPPKDPAQCTGRLELRMDC